MKIMKRFPLPRGGQGIVEMALVLPLFIFILVAIIDLAWLFHVQTSIDSMCIRAARAGTKRINQIVARNMFTSTTHAAPNIIASAFWDTLSPMTNKSNFSPDSPVIDITQENYRSVKVAATYHHQPLLGGFLPDTWSNFTLQRAAVERKE